jgi:hypothetical protein
MVLILLSVISAAFAVAIAMIHTSCGILADPGTAGPDVAIGNERSEQPSITSPTKQVSPAVLPDDGKVVDQR